MEDMGAAWFWWRADSMDFLVSLLDKVAAVFRDGPGRDLAIITVALLILAALVSCAWTFFRLKLMVEGLGGRVTLLEKRFKRARKVAAENHKSQSTLLRRIIRAMNIPTEIVG